jgi:hypothetical protein
VSRCVASWRPGNPRAASGSRGGVDVAPSVDSSFSSPPFFLLRCAVVRMGMRP